MIDVRRDAEGLRLVLGEMLERDYDLFRIGPQLEGKPTEVREKLLASVARVTLSPGYERWARHILLLERLHKLGLPLGELLAVEVSGLDVLDGVRLSQRVKHPSCYACGMAQPTRFQTECVDCGAKFSRKGGR